jgi:hypothetical protein
LASQGFRVHAVDLSPTGLAFGRGLAAGLGQALDWRQEDITATGLPGDSMAFVLSWGSIYYGTREHVQRCIAEIHRILHPGCFAFIVCRSTEDYRFGRGEAIEPGTFRLATPETNEAGLVNHFIGEEEIGPLFSAFAEIDVGIAEWRLEKPAPRTDVDWLIAAVK